MDGESSVLQQLARRPEHPTFKKKPQRWGWGFSSPPLRETSNGSVLSITPANYRKLNTPRQLCGFACRAGKAIWEIQTFSVRRALELYFLTYGQRICSSAVMLTLNHVTC
jgi:hypothetical protein